MPKLIPPVKARDFGDYADAHFTAMDSPPGATFETGRWWAELTAFGGHSPSGRQTCVIAAHRSCKQSMQGKSRLVVQGVPVAEVPLLAAQLYRHYRQEGGE